MANEQKDITVFLWNEFPVEKTKFTTCICKDGIEESKLDELLNFIKLIYPEDYIVYTTPKDLIEYKNRISVKKSTIIFDLCKTTDWAENLYILDRYLDRAYFIIIGLYEHIPKIYLTISDIMIFNDEETINKYLSTRHNSLISNFNHQSYYCLLDKRRMGMKINGLIKSNLTQYSN